MSHPYPSDEAVKYQGIPTGFPRIPGHEIIGDVVAIPPSEFKWKVGQRVGSGWHGGHCHVCKLCRAGDYIMCEKENINGVLLPRGSVFGFGGSHAPRVPQASFLTVDTLSMLLCARKL